MKACKTRSLEGGNDDLAEPIVGVMRDGGLDQPLHAVEIACQMGPRAVRAEESLGVLVVVVRIETPLCAQLLEGGEAEVLVHYTLSEDIRALKRVKDAIAAGRPLPMALRENRVWGMKERLFERVLPRLTDVKLAELLQAAHLVDGIVKGLKQAHWPQDGWQAIHRLAHMLCLLCVPQAPALTRSRPPPGAH